MSVFLFGGDFKIIIMTQFDKIAGQLGWIKPYSEIDLWYKKGEDWYTCVFEMSDIVGGTVRFGDLVEDVVERCLAVLPTTKFKEESIEWVLPTLVSDYFYWRRDVESEIKWAKIAMSKNREIKKETFSTLIQDRL